MKKVVAALLSLSLMLLVVANFEVCSANPFGPAHTIPIYIRSDGSIEPPNAPIKNVGGNNFVFTDDLSPPPSDSLLNRSLYTINIEKDNIVLDGLNHTFTGLDGQGIEIFYRHNVTVQNIVISNFKTAIEIVQSSGVNVTNSVIRHNNYAFDIYNCSQLVIANNNLLDNWINGQISIRMTFCNSTIIYGNTISCPSAAGNEALRMDCCQNNYIVANTFNNYLDGADLLNSSSNVFSGNNFNCSRVQAQDLLNLKRYQEDNVTYWRFIELNKTKLAEGHAKLFHTPLYASINTWTNNYWCNYNGTGGADGVGLSPYVLDDRNADNSPVTKWVLSGQATPLDSIQTNNPEPQAINNQVPLTYAMVAAAIAAVVATAFGFLYRRNKRKQNC